MEKNQPAWYIEFRRKEDLFWNQTYPAKTWEEKIDHWVERIHEMMRSLAGSGSDAYEGFNPEAYREWQQYEPRIDEILGQMKVKLQDFDEESMWRGIRG